MNKIQIHSTCGESHHILHSLTKVICEKWFACVCAACVYRWIRLERVRWLERSRYEKEKKNSGEKAIRRKQIYALDKHTIFIQIIIVKWMTLWKCMTCIIVNLIYNEMEWYVIYKKIKLSWSFMTYESSWIWNCKKSP